MNEYEPYDPMGDMWKQGFWAGIILCSVMTLISIFFLLLFWVF